MWLRRAEVRRLLDQIRELKEQIVSLKAEACAERERNRRREDELLDRVLTAAGRYALTPESKPDKSREPVRPVVTALDEARLLAYRQAAVEAGRTEQEANALWKAQISGEPFEPPWMAE